MTIGNAAPCRMRESFANLSLGVAAKIGILQP
jgi:hypothetical protein